MTKILVSLSAWLTPSTKTLLVKTLPDGFSVRKGIYKDSKSSKWPAYYLLDGSELAGHVVFFERDGKYWMDKVYLEEQYRGKNFAKNFLWIALQHWLKRHTSSILLVHGWSKHLKLYASLGFSFVPKKDLGQYEEDFKWRSRNYAYPHPMSTYTLMIHKGLQ